MEMSVRFPHLNLDFKYVGQSFRIFGFEITIYGILIAVGMLLGIFLVVLEAKRKNQDQDKYLDMMIISLAAAVIGARLFYVFFSKNLYDGNFLEMLNLRNGGSAFYGGLFTGILAAAIFCKLAKLPFMEMADMVVPGILLGQVIGRWGNFFNRESFGEYTDSLFAMQLPLSAVRSGEVTAAMRENLITERGISYIQVHPVFLYESIWCLLLLFSLLAVRRRKKFQGELFMRYLSGYGFGRFFFEWLRTDKLLIPGTKIGICLVISACLFLIFTPAAAVMRIMAEKRENRRKRRREKIYEAEEEIYRKAEEEERLKEEARKKELLQKQEETERLQKMDSYADKTGNTQETDSHPEKAENTQEINSHPEKEKKTEETDIDNWEISEYAHIPEKWRKAIQSEHEEIQKNIKQEKNPDSAISGGESQNNQNNS